MSKPNWSPEQTLKQAQLNVCIAILITQAHYRSIGASIREASEFAGDIIAKGWGEAKGAPAVDIAKMIAFNPVSMGATVVSVEGNEKEATAIVDWSFIEQFDNMNLPAGDDLTTFMRIIHEKITDYLEIGFALNRNGSRWSFKVAY